MNILLHKLQSLKTHRLFWFLVASFLACFYILLLHHYTTGSLGFPKYNDHLRHLRFAYEFLFRGWHIYDTSMLQFAHIGSEYSYEWPNIIYLYPLGVVYLFIPFALVSFSGLISFGKIANLLVLIFLLFAHINTYLLHEKLLRKQSEFFLRRIFVGLFYILSVWWAFHGQYESLVVFCILMAARREDIRSRFVWLAGGFFLKLQTLFFFPIFLQLMWQGYKKQMFKSWQFIAGFVVFVLNGLMMITVRHQLIPRVTNPIHLSHFSLLQFLVLSLLALFIGYAIWRKRWWLLVLVTFQTLCLMIVGELQGWYLTLIFVTPLFLDDAKDQEMHMLWFILFLWLMNLLPPFSYMMDEVLRGLI